MYGDKDGHDDSSKAMRMGEEVRFMCLNTLDRESCSACGSVYRDDLGVEPGELESVLD